MRSRLNLLVAVFCFLLVLPESAWSRSIEVEGTGLSKEEAIRNGLRSAVEHVVGVYLVSRSQVKEFVLEDDTITTETAGFVKSYRILSCGRDYALAEGFNPALRLKSTHTIMEGARTCDLLFTLEEER